MTRTIFFSWQRDRKSSTNRGLIRAALDKAVENLNAEISDADREEVVVDQDTAGVPGSPPIAETIFSKVSECDVFVPDLTFVAQSDYRLHPNPNVLIEYGYALARRSDARIVPVFNTAFGRVEDLPFDIRQKRVVQFHAPEGESTDDQAARRAAKEHLARALVFHLGSVLSAASAPSSVAAFEEAKPVSGSASFVAPMQILGRVDRDWRPNSRVKVLRLRAGPLRFLRVIPTQRTSVLPHVETESLVRQGPLFPLRPRSSLGVDTARNTFGAFSYCGTEPVNNEPDIETVLSITQLFRTREIWGIDSASLAHKNEDGDFFIPTTSVEESFRSALRGYVHAARTLLGLDAALKLRAGFWAVEGYCLAVAGGGFRGVITEPDVTVSGEFSSEEQGLRLLDGLFDACWDAAGLQRITPPATR